MGTLLPKDNPLVQIDFRFQDGSGLRWKFDPPVPQLDSMRALGQLAAELHQDRLTIEPLRWR